MLPFSSLVVASIATLSSCFLFRTGLDASTAMTAQATRDEMWNEWGNGGGSGLLPAQTHLVLHNPTDTVDENNGLFSDSGNAPEVVEYVILYDLSFEKGGMQYASAADTDGNGNLTFSDLITSTTLRTMDLIPMTGAIEYGCQAGIGLGRTGPMDGPRDSRRGGEQDRPVLEDVRSMCNKHVDVPSMMT